MNNNIVNGNGNGSEGGIVRPALVLFVLLSALTGLIYPMAVTGVAKTAFPAQADGSLIVLDGTVVGSKLIGQNFSDPRHFWSRPSATAPQPYNASASGGSNQGPLNPALADAVKARVEALRAADPDNTAPVPVDLVTASASGLDPDISLAAAQYQAARVARVRGMPLSEVQSLIDRNTQKPLLGFLGEARVNVLALNIALDAASGSFSPSVPR
ncbi:potassium-transporting ATPase subunit KdpC [Variovorax sp. Varisp85]|uniref:potassium-transporting ATPase subunit KdpC n=1 Tax=Variovorax sp. Varisp85 TaxID=3243059 RepID=UPI0039A64BD7